MTHEPDPNHKFAGLCRTAYGVIRRWQMKMIGIRNVISLYQVHCTFVRRAHGGVMGVVSVSSTKRQELNCSRRALGYFNIIGDKAQLTAR